MSQENVELVYRAYAAFNRRDLDAALALHDPDVEIEPLLGAALGTTYRGHDGLRKWWEELLSAFPDFSAEPLEVRDLGDLVLGALHVRGHGAGSDVQFDQTIWQVGEWRDGKLLWFRTYTSEREALEAVGLRE